MTDRLKIFVITMTCFLMAAGWASTAWHVRTLVTVTEVAQAGAWQCVDVVLVKLDDLEAGISDEQQRIYLLGSRRFLEDRP